MNFPPQISVRSGTRGMRWWIRWSTRALTVRYGHSALTEEPLWIAPVLLKYQHKLSHQRKRVKFKCDRVISFSVNQKEIHGFCPGVLCVIRRAHLNEKKSKRWDVLGCLSSLSPLPQTEFLALTLSMPTGERPLGCWLVRLFINVAVRGGRIMWLVRINVTHARCWDGAKCLRKTLRAAGWGGSMYGSISPH